MLIEEYKDALQARYRFLRLKIDRDILHDLRVEYTTDNRLAEMKLLKSIARLNGWEREPTALPDNEVL